MSRVVVIGTSCAGKSTFARKLAHLRNVPHVELDQLFWGPDWTPKPPEQFRALVAAATEAEQWVVDGNYSGVRDILWSKASTVVWMNYGLPTVLWRAISRTVHRTFSQAELWHGNRESFRRSFMSRESILVWVVSTCRRRQREFANLRTRAAYPHLSWLEFGSPAAAARFLRGEGGDG